MLPKRVNMLIITDSCNSKYIHNTVDSCVTNIEYKNKSAIYIIC